MKIYAVIHRPPKAGEFSYRYSDDVNQKSFVSDNVGKGKAFVELS